VVSGAEADADEEEVVDRVSVGACWATEGDTLAVGMIRAVEDELSSLKFAPDTEVVVGSTAKPAETEVGEGTIVDEGATDDTATELEATVLPEDAKLLFAVTDDPELIPTSFTITTSPSELVTLTSTVVVPNPLEFSKKLYVCRVVPCQVLPPSVLTSSLETALLALTTCMLNQNAETPSLLCNCKGEVMGQST